MADELEQLPRVVALAWGMLEHPQRGPKRELSHELIVDAAIEVADAEGLAAVTMSRVAASLGFTTMSLYRYVTSKDELLQLMCDAASGGTIPPPPDGDGDWRYELRQWALLARGSYSDHPWFIEIPISFVQLMMPNNMMMADLAVRGMRTLRVTDDEKIAILMVLSSFVRSFAMLERDLSGSETPSPAQGHELGSAAAAIREIVTAERFPDLYSMIKTGNYLTDIGAEGTTGLSIDDFDFGLARLLDGFALYQEEHGSEGPPSEPQADDVRLVDETVRRDKSVREAAKARREAKAKLREATKREREMIKKAQERGKKEAEASAKQVSAT